MVQQDRMQYILVQAITELAMLMEVELGLRTWNRPYTGKATVPRFFI